MEKLRVLSRIGPEMVRGDSNRAVYRGRVSTGWWRAKAVSGALGELIDWRQVRSVASEDQYVCK